MIACLMFIQWTYLSITELELDISNNTFFFSPAKLYGGSFIYAKYLDSQPGKVGYYCEVSSQLALGFQYSVKAAPIPFSSVLNRSFAARLLFWKKLPFTMLTLYHSSSLLVPFSSCSSFLSLQPIFFLIYPFLTVLLSSYFSTFHKSLREKGVRGEK